MFKQNDKTPIYEVSESREAPGGVVTVATQRISGFVVWGTP